MTSRLKKIILVIFSVQFIWLYSSWSDLGFNFSYFGLKTIKTNVSQTTDGLSKIFENLYYANAFVADIELLKHINAHSGKLDYINNDTIQNIIKSETIILTFGLFAWHKKEAHNKLQYLFENNTICSFDESNLKCQSYNLTIQLATFETRGNFIYINGTDQEQPQKWFGDIPRSMSTFNITTLKDRNGIKIYIPSTIPRFLFDYEHSKFIECNRHLANEMKEKYFNKRTQQELEKAEKLHARILKSMNFIVEKFENLHKHYYICSGSLLGWYRDCGLSPHVHDVDFGLWAHEYDDRLRDAFLKPSLPVKLLLTFGQPDNGYEMRLHNGEFQFDMFFIYNHNQTHNWTVFYEDKLLYKQYLESFELCTGEINGFRFLVVCDPDPYITRDYGNWKVPAQWSKKWQNVDFKNPVKLESTTIKRYNSIG